MSVQDAMTVAFIVVGMLSVIAAMHALALGAPIPKTYGLFAVAAIWILIGFFRMFVNNVIH